MSFQVTFINVGSAKSNWEVTVPSLDYHTLLKELKRRHAIFSRHPDIDWWPDGKSKSSGTGSIGAGWRTVGTFTWKEIKDEKPKAKTKKTVSA